MLVRVKVQKKYILVGWGVRCYNCIEGGKVGRREQGRMVLYSSDEDEKFTIIVSMMVIELKNRVCSV